MKVLLDTNLLVRLASGDDPNHAIARDAISTLRARGDEVFVVPQNIYEFWTAVTRQQNGPRLEPSVAVERIETLLTDFVLLTDPPGLTQAFVQLMKRYEVRGTNAYDGRLAAAMQLHELTHLLTFNASDFRRYEHITLVDPANVLSEASDL